jgi:hypothetical protein
MDPAVMVFGGSEVAAHVPELSSMRVTSAITFAKRLTPIPSMLGVFSSASTSSLWLYPFHPSHHVW